MVTIPFTQYLRPNGRQKPVTIEVSDEIGKMANELIAFGCHFDIEELQTGMISMTCEKEDRCLSIQLSENGPPVVKAVDELIIFSRREMDRPYDPDYQSGPEDFEE